MTRLALNATAGRQLSAPLALSLHALSEAEAGGTAEIVQAVIPAAGRDGRLKTRDGTALRMSDPAAVAATLNAQDTGVRIDFDHQSEPSSPTYQGSTAAEGWAKSFRAAADGSVEAVLELSSRAREAVGQARYKYLSPAIWAHKRTGEVAGMNSLALVNNPNMVSLSLHSADGGDDEQSLDERERKIADREKAVEQRLMSAAERAVDDAIEGKRLAPAQKDFVLNSIRTHGDGIEKGIEAFEKAFPADAKAPLLNNLDRRVGPTGAPGGTSTAAASSFVVPPGRSVDEEGLTLHSQVTTYAREHNISYREAVLQLGAMQ